MEAFKLLLNSVKVTLTFLTSIPYFQYFLNPFRKAFKRSVQKTEVFLGFNSSIHKMLIFSHGGKY